MAKKSTYGTISKWFKWSSLIILIVPIAELILIAIAIAQPNTKPDWFATGMFALWIINIVSAVIWVVLNIIMFCAAGTVRNEGPSPLGIRIGLLITIVLVVGPIILAFFADKIGDWVYWVWVFAPTAGYIIAAVMGSKLQHNL